ncbi:MAG: hypothetical protein C4541_04165 [Candidatus Auribacter fodinae]|jgi:hypothetical protein|uniref:BACON domain-containing protein n=1 Tax=Candidatus Auribacter fodinae TaxID=2093366 RepID=A0A3A4R5J8_9BACT|nr:MAG: hypothetical protein C4541_04165 [Candidatus Auribacter fodinae]
MLSLIKYYSCFVLLFLPSLAYGNYGVEPSRIEGSMPAGKTYENVYVITNPQSHAISVELEWRDYTINPLAKDWLVLSQTKVTVEAQSSVRVPITITIPENAAGEYTARVIFTQIPDKSDQVKFAIRYNNPIYIKIKGTERYNFEVKNIQINNQKRFRVILETLNTGNVHIRPSGWR